MTRHSTDLLLGIVYALACGLFTGAGWSAARYGPSPRIEPVLGLACIVAFAACAVGATLSAAAAYVCLDAWWVGRRRR